MMMMMMMSAVLCSCSVVRIQVAPATALHRAEAGEKQVRGIGSGDAGYIKRDIPMLFLDTHPPRHSQNLIFNTQHSRELRNET